MPYQFVIDKSAGIIRETWTGSVNLQQIKESCHEEWSHPDYHKDMHMISDFRDAKVELSSSELWMFVRWFGQQESLGKHAMVVSREVGYGLARMFSSISEGKQNYADALRIFHSLEDANEWIASESERKTS